PPHIRPAPTARSLVRAFFGLCMLTEALEGRTAVTARLTDWWLLTLGSLQQRPDAPGVLERALRRSTSREGARKRIHPRNATGSSAVATNTHSTQSPAWMWPSPSLPRVGRTPNGDR
ncbi:hypothetical protein AB8B12_30905, partial [Streptomyces sp. PGLac3x]